MNMEFTLLPIEPSDRPIILYNFFNIGEGVPISDRNATLVLDQEQQPAADYCSLELTLSCPAHTTWSSSSSLSSNGSKKRKALLSHHGAPKRKAILTHHRQATLTEQRLGPHNGDEFVIKKTLTTSDVDGMSRLMLCREAAKKHVLAYWDEEQKERLNHKDGVYVKVLDSDTGYETQLTMKRWKHNKSTVLNGMWISDFVRRRQLKRGDEIGLYWNQPDSRLVFSVLNQAPPADQQQQQLDLPIPIEATPIRYCLPN